MPGEPVEPAVAAIEDTLRVLLQIREIREGLVAKLDTVHRDGLLWAEVTKGSLAGRFGRVYGVVASDTGRSAYVRLYVCSRSKPLHRLDKLPGQKRGSSNLVSYKDVRFLRATPTADGNVDVVLSSGVKHTLRPGAFL